MRSVALLAGLIGTALAAPYASIGKFHKRVDPENKYTIVKPGGVDDVIVDEDNTLNGTAIGPKTNDGDASNVATMNRSMDSGRARDARILERLFCTRFGPFVALVRRKMRGACAMPGAVLLCRRLPMLGLAAHGLWGALDSP